MAFTSTPAARNACTTSRDPPRTAKKNGVKPGIEARIQVGSSLDQSVDDGGVPFGRGPHQGRLVQPFA